YQLLDLPWEDVLVTNVLCYLPLRQLVSLQRVSKNFCSLVQVYLANCRTFDPAQTGPRIPKEAFCSMLRVDSLALRSLADHCGDLRSLDLTACRQLRDEAVSYAVAKWPSLRSLSVAVNANITDLAVEEVAKRCRELEQLDLTGCLRVRNEAIRLSLHRWVYLEHLSVLARYIYHG
ncbi:hypothetical protein NFI96_012571, partial [Prochilodus magdalenae]